jgi:phosphoribosylamine--glycine ligase
MRVLVIGGGAREHALAARLLVDPGVSDVIVAPGNPGISRIARTTPISADHDAVIHLAQHERVGLTIIGPEAPLSLGLADRLVAAGIPTVGPSAAAARLESSKAFAKSFMARHCIPTARFRICTSLDDALATLRSAEFAFPVVLKADGLAAGKGVVIAEDRASAEAAAIAAMRDRRFGAAGDCLVIEECMTGPEVSFFVVSDGTRSVGLGTAQDHKRIFDDDRGPNTGGMGAFAQSPLVDAALDARIMREIVSPVVEGMAAEGCRYSGFLYVGLMLTAGGPKVIEFNVRLGDPEAQVILPLIDEPLAAILEAVAHGRLQQSAVRLSPDRAVCIVLASRGYPESSESDRVIKGVEDAERAPGVAVYHAGTAMKNGELVTAGGRVLTIAGRGPGFSDAVARAYAAAQQVTFDGMQYRRDIGRTALIEPKQ